MYADQPTTKKLVKDLARTHYGEELLDKNGESAAPDLSIGICRSVNHRISM